MKHQIKAWHSSPEYAKEGDLQDPDALAFSNNDMRDCGWLCVGEATIELEIKISQEDLMLSMCDTLRKQIENVRAEAQQKVNKLQDRIDRLQALTYQEAL
jgi:hypothetical protein